MGSSVKKISSILLLMMAGSLMGVVINEQFPLQLKLAYIIVFMICLVYTKYTKKIDYFDLLVLTWITLGYFFAINKVTGRYNDRKEIFGRFNFQEDQFTTYTIIFLIGVVGVYLAMVIVGNKKRWIKKTKIISSPKAYIYIFLIATLILAYIANSKNIGIMGIKNENYNFPVVGIYYYTRNIVYPIIISIMLDMILIKYGKIDKKLIIIILFYSVLMAMLSLSKKQIVFYLAPIIIYIIISSKIRLRTAFAALIVLQIIAITLSIMAYSRLQIYSGSMDFTMQSMINNLFIINVSDIINLVSIRLGGTSELLAVSSNFDLFTINKTLESQDYNEYIYGINIGEKYAGMGVTLFGYFAMSGNYLVIFFGVFLTTILIKLAVNYFKELNKITAGMLTTLIFFEFIGGDVSRLFTITYPFLLISSFAIKNALYTKSNNGII